MAGGIIAPCVETTDMNARSIIRRLLCDDDGQDLIEYGLLAATIGLAGVAVFPLIQPLIPIALTNWSTGVYNIWIPPDPAAP
jgi:Flp pilus assembly pilin Flp